MFNFASAKTYAQPRDARDAYTSEEMEGGLLANMDNFVEAKVIGLPFIIFFFLLLCSFSSFFLNSPPSLRLQRKKKSKKEGEEDLSVKPTRTFLPSTWELYPLMLTWRLVTLPSVKNVELTSTLSPSLRIKRNLPLLLLPRSLLLESCGFVNFVVAIILLFSMMKKCPLTQLWITSWKLLLFMKPLIALVMLFL